jgi:hypothetical protein
MSLISAGSISLDSTFKERLQSSLKGLSHETNIFLKAYNNK